MSTSVNTVTPQQTHRQPLPVDEECLPIPARRIASPITLTTYSTLPRTSNTSLYRPLSPSWQMYRHKPYLSMQGVTYQVFPSPAKLTTSWLQRSQKTLLPLVAKFEAMDVLPSGSDVEKNISTEGLEMRRTYRGTESVLKEKATLGILNIKERTTGLRNQVLGLLDRGESRNGHTTRRVSEERRCREIHEGVDIIQEDSRESQRAINDPSAPKTSGLSHSRHNMSHVTQENPRPSASETNLRIWLPTLNSRKGFILRQQGVSEIRDKIWFFDGCPEGYPQETYCRDLKEKTNDLSEKVSSRKINEKPSLKRKEGDQLHKTTGRATSRPTSGPGWRRMSLNSVDSKGRNPIQPLPSGYDCSHVREVERGRTRERVPRAGTVEPIHPTFIDELWNSQNIAQTRFRTTSKESKPQIGELQVMDKVAGVNKVSIREVGKNNKTAHGDTLRQFLPPKTASMWRVKEGAASWDGKPKTVASQSEENPRGQLKPRGESLVRKRIKQFSFVIAPTASASTSRGTIAQIIAINNECPTGESIRQFASGNGMGKGSANTERQTPEVYTGNGTEPRESMTPRLSRGMIDTEQYRYEQSTEKNSSPGNVVVKETISPEKEDLHLSKTAAARASKTIFGATRVAAHEKRNPATLAVTQSDDISTTSKRRSRLEPRNDIKEARLSEKPIQAKQNRFATIRGKIKVLEDFAGRKLQRNSSSSTKESKVSVERRATTRYLVDLNLMTSGSTSDFGAPLQSVGRVATRTSRSVKDNDIADQSDLRSNGRIRQWWNDGLEAMPSISKPAGVKDKPETKATMQRTRAREERAYRRAVRVSPEESSSNETQRSKRKTTSTQGEDGNADGFNRNECESQKWGSSLDELQGMTGKVDGHASTASLEIVKAELCFNPCSPSRTQSPVNELSTVVKYSCSDGKSSSTLKLVLQKRSAAEALGNNNLGKMSGDVDNNMKKDRIAVERDRKLGPNANFHIVETVIAQCELTQPRPRRLLEIQRMVKLCRRFGKRDRSWSRELHGLCAVADAGLEAVGRNDENSGKK